jgi:hypothetical protein
LRSAHQNDLKTSKTYYFKAKKKIKNSNFLKSAFQQQCQTPSKVIAPIFFLNNNNNYKLSNY